MKALIIIAIPVIPIVLLMYLFGMWADELMNIIIGPKPVKKWIRKTGPDGKYYLLPDDFHRKIKSTIK